MQRFLSKGEIKPCRNQATLQTAILPRVYGHQYYRLQLRHSQQRFVTINYVYQEWHYPLKVCFTTYQVVFQYYSLTTFQPCKQQLCQRLFLCLLHRRLLSLEYNKGDQPGNWLIRLYYRQFAPHATYGETNYKMWVCIDAWNNLNYNYASVKD